MRLHSNHSYHKDRVSILDRSSRPGSNSTIDILKDPGFGLGSRGPAVQELQQLLDDAGFLSGEASGHYDENTESAVEAFQQDRLDVLNTRISGNPCGRKSLIEERNRLFDEMCDGVAGEETRKQLEKYHSATDTPTTDHSQQLPDVPMNEPALDEFGFSRYSLDGLTRIEELNKYAFEQDFYPGDKAIVREPNVIAIDRDTVNNDSENSSDTTAASEPDRLIELDTEESGVTEPALVERPPQNIENGVNDALNESKIVAQLQKNLITAGFSLSSVNGIFDRRTASALGDFQQNQIQDLTTQRDQYTDVFGRVYFQPQIERLYVERDKGIAGEETLDQLDKFLNRGKLSAEERLLHEANAEPVDSAPSLTDAFSFLSYSASGSV